MARAGRPPAAVAAPRFMGVSALAARWAYSEAAVRDLIAKGYFATAFRVGEQGPWRIAMSEVEAIEAGRTPVAS